jgi:hypothetical protein
VVFAVDMSIVVSELLMYDQRVIVKPFSLSDASVHESFTENESTLMTVKFVGAFGTELFSVGFFLLHPINKAAVRIAKAKIDFFITYPHD